MWQSRMKTKGNVVSTRCVIQAGRGETVPFLQSPPPYMLPSRMPAQHHSGRWNVPTSPNRMHFTGLISAVASDVHEHLPPKGACRCTRDRDGISLAQQPIRTGDHGTPYPSDIVFYHLAALLAQTSKTCRCPEEIKFEVWNVLIGNTTHTNMSIGTEISINIWLLIFSAYII